MSSITSFKQKCPSCGGQLTIKNSDLIGKKIDCPKCKHRFVVESPDEEKPAKSKRKEGRDDADRPKKKAKGGNKMLIFGCVAGGVILVVGVILLFMLTGGGSETTKPGDSGQRAGGGSRPGGESQNQQPSDPLADLDDGTKADAAKDRVWTMLQNDESLIDKLRDKALAGCQPAHDLIKKAANEATKAELQTKAKGALSDIQKQLASDGGDPKNDPTNFLPNNTQVVLYVPVAKLLDTNLG